jgi:hypothetical protein
MPIFGNYGMNFGDGDAKAALDFRLVTNRAVHRGVL